VPNGGALQVNDAHPYTMPRLRSPPATSVFNHSASALLKNLELRGGRAGQRLHSGGIEAIDFWRDPHPACDSRAFPESAELRNSIVEIPCHQDISSETLSRMAEVVRHAL
jgi:dTDP-4-amino-4,6-dideoxygalactose transaminase